jgi:hypothetical protein
VGSKCYRQALFVVTNLRNEMLLALGPVWRRTFTHLSNALSNPFIP